MATAAYIFEAQDALVIKNDCGKAEGTCPMLNVVSPAATRRFVQAKT